MKTFKTYHQSFLYIYLLTLIILGFIAVLTPQLIHWLFYTNIIFLFLLLILFCIPKKYTNYNSCLSSNYKNYLSVFLKLTGLQIIIAFITINFNLVIFQLAPGKLTLSLSQSLSNDFHHFFSWGFFPWSFILVLSIAFGWQRQFNKNISTLRDTPCLWHKNRTNPVITAGFDLLGRQALIISLSLLTLLLGLSLYFYMTLIGVPQIIFHPSGYTLLLYLLLLVGISNRWWKKLIKRLWLKQFTTPQLFLLQTIVTVFGMILLIFILEAYGKIINLNLAETYLFPMPTLKPNFAWMLVKWSFWISSAVFISHSISGMVRTIPLRSFIALSLFWPIFFFLFLQWPHGQQWITHILIWLKNPIIYTLFNIFFIIAITLFCFINRSFDQILIQYFYHQSNKLHHRYPAKMLYSFLRLTTFLFLLYIFAGINLLGLLLFSITGIVFWMLTDISLGIFKTLLQQNTVKPHQGPQQ